MLNLNYIKNYFNDYNDINDTFHQRSPIQILPNILEWNICNVNDISGIITRYIKMEYKSNCKYVWFIF